MPEYNNTTSIICEPTEGEWKIYSNISWWMDGIASPVISSAGLLLNTLAIVTLTKSKKVESMFFNYLLVCLAIFDNLYLSNGILGAIRKYIIESSYSFDYVFIKLIFPFRSMVMFCSMYTTIILAFERYNAIKKPMSYKRRATQKIATSVLNIVYYIIPVLLSSVLFYLPKFFEFDISLSNETSEKNNNAHNTSAYQQDYLIKETSLRKNKSYIFWYSNVLNHIITIVIPLIMLMYLNFGIYLELKMFKKRQPSSRTKIRDIQMEQKGMKKEDSEKNEQSIMIISLVFMFILCHSLRAVLNIQELVNFEWKFKEISNGCAGVKFWAMVLVPFSEFMLLTNSSANFFIYFLFHNDFRFYLQRGHSTIVSLKSMWAPCKSSNNSFGSNGFEKSNKIEMEDIAEIHNGFE